MLKRRCTPRSYFSYFSYLDIILGPVAQAVHALPVVRTSRKNNASTFFSTYFCFFFFFNGFLLLLLYFFVLPRCGKIYGILGTHVGGLHRGPESDTPPFRLKTLLYAVIRFLCRSLASQCKTYTG